MPIDIPALIQTIIVMTLLIGIVVTIHEFGHYIAAKLCGVRVDEFAFGMGKMLIGKKWKGTLFRLNLLPLGGYVKVHGQEGSINEPDSFSTKKPLQKIFILINGVVMNAILGIIIFTIYLLITNFVVIMPKSEDISMTFDHVGIVEELPRIAEVTEGMSAERAGIPQNSIVLGMNGKKVYNVEEFKSVIRSNFNKEITIKVQKLQDLSISEYKVLVSEKNAEGAPIIGVIIPGEVYRLDYSGNKLLAPVAHTLNYTKYNLALFGNLISQSFKDRSLTKIGEGTGTIVQATRYTYKFIEASYFLNVLELCAAISLSVGIFNLLPIPALDGGYIFLVLIETITRKKLSDKWLNRFVGAGYIALMGLFVILLLRDFLQFGFIQNVIDSLSKLFGR